MGKRSPVIMQRPILGGAFAAGEYALASLAEVDSGLHAVRYLVINPRTGAVVSAARDKGEAIAAARRVILATAAVPWPGSAANDPHYCQLELFPDAPTPAPAPGTPRPGRVSRRRREVFERSEGRCMYCSAALTLDGRWHVEHSQPKALGGTDDPLNLVAACESCNLRKGPRSALEFLAARERDAT